MGPIQRAVRRALNPISTHLTTLVQGAANHRALAAGWQPLVGRRLVRAGTVPVAGQVAVPDVIGLVWDDAIGVLRRVGLVAVGPDPDGPPSAALVAAWCGR